MVQWQLVPPEEWPHYFIYTLESIPRNWYIELELRGGLKIERKCSRIVITFAFEQEKPMVDTTLKVVRDRIFEELEFEIVTSYQNQNSQTVRQLLHYYHVVEDDLVEEKSCDIHITEVEREREL
jgi:hypothetical protein